LVYVKKPQTIVSEICLDDQKFNEVNEFLYLSSMITAYGKDTLEIKRHRAGKGEYRKWLNIDLDTNKNYTV